MTEAKPAPEQFQITFTLNEVLTMRAGLDSIVRTEGKGLSDVGIVGLGQGRANMLSERFIHVLSAAEKLETLTKLLAPKPPSESEG